MDKETIKAVSATVESLFNWDAWKAVKYVSPSFIVRATVRLTRRKLPRKNERREVLLTIGRPNAKEAVYIKNARKNKEIFPLKGVALQFPPKPKKKGKK